MEIKKHKMFPKHLFFLLFFFFLQKKYVNSRLSAFAGSDPSHRRMQLEAIRPISDLARAVANPSFGTAFQGCILSKPSTRNLVLIILY